jgi:predicted transcriptional regulator of viral defense system
MNQDNVVRAPDRPMDRLLALLARQGVLRPRDLAAHGIPPVYLQRLARAGRVERIGRGLYEPVGGDFTAEHSLAEAAKRVPQGVVCLLSALRFHELTTQNPHDIWLAIPPRAWAPREPGLPLRLVRFSGKALTEGIETHRIEGVDVRVYSPAKTVADCFKYRNKVGLDVALEALRDVWRGRRATMDELLHYARLCRVANVMRPYRESLVWAGRRAAWPADEVRRLPRTGTAVGKRL